MMRRLGTWLVRLLGLGVLAVVAVALFGPTEPVETDVTFDPAGIGDDVDAYFAQAEAAFDDNTPGTQKRVQWADTPNTKTKLSILYVHGYSATSEEIRPVPDRVAETLGANLVFTRLTGHGRSGDAMTEATVELWMQDMAEALAVARQVGDEVIVIATSTGATLATMAAEHPEMIDAVKGMVFVSPNFRIQAPASAILTWPLVRYWGPLVAGPERSFPARNADHEKYWTTRYPTVALLPMAAAVKYARHLDHSALKQPLLLVFSDDDNVVSPDATRAVGTRWGGPVTRQMMVMGPGDDENSHVVAGDILSPGQTDTAIAAILAWIGAL